MKSLVFLILFVTLSWASDIEDCAKETKLSDEELARFQKDDLTSEDPTAHCFVKCLLAKKNFFDDAGLPKKEVIAPYLRGLNPDKDVKEIMADCLKLIAEDGSGSCLTTYMRYKCSIQKGLVVLS
uniref:Pbp/gobp family n=2 Tax=Lutzomyia longipalpis TaxID=7200 RepID=A0A1B0CHQ6_LUTLO